jgi:hypothetical protein
VRRSNNIVSTIVAVEKAILIHSFYCPYSLICIVHSVKFIKQLIGDDSCFLAAIYEMDIFANPHSTILLEMFRC